MRAEYSLTQKKQVLKKYLLFLFFQSTAASNTHFAQYIADMNFNRISREFTLPFY